MSDLYESMFILDPTLTEEGVEEELERVRKAVSSGGGEVEALNVWGRRELAYEIGGHEEGIYALLYFRGAEAVPELKREMALAAGIIRHMVVAANEAAIWPLGEAAPAEEKAEPSEEAEPAPEAAAEVAAAEEEAPEAPAAAEQAPAEEPTPEEPSGEEEAAEGESPGEEASGEEEAAEEKPEES